MTHSINRFEKLFTKRKQSSLSIDPTLGRLPSSQVTKPDFLDENVFPAPSYLRPTSSRLVARTESSTVTFRDGQRASSLSGSRSGSRSGGQSLHSSKPSIASSRASSSHSPSTPHSMTRGAKQEGLDKMDEFQFPKPPKSAQGTQMRMSPSSLPPSPTSLKDSVTSPTESWPDKQSEMKDFAPNRVDTPPSSDHEEDKLRPLPTSKSLTLPSGAHPPTPETSPEMKPAKTTRNRSSSVFPTSRRERFTPVRTRKFAKVAALRRSHSHAGFFECRRQVARHKVLNGGNAEDFLSLDDDDVAEIELEAPAQISPQEPSTRECKDDDFFPTPAFEVPVGDDSAELITDAAALGAIKAAQLAAKYHFDLVYIVNLWPDETNASRLPTDKTGGDSSPVECDEGHLVKTDKGLNGRLLASYGLDKVVCPFRISTAVHSKILRLPGWVEYRQAQAEDGELSRGYGHGFHKSNSLSPHDSSDAEADRGIVFAAYQQPRADGTTRGCTTAELASLHSEVEYLIDMLIAIHRARRLGNSVALRALATSISQDSRKASSSTIVPPQRPASS